MSDLVVRDLVAGYGRAEVIHGVDLEVGEGQVAAVLGANGAGKTTLLRALSGLTWARGTVEFDGEPIRGRAVDVIARLGIAHVPQGRGTFTDLTVEENLRVGAYRRGLRAGGEDVDSWYDAFPRLAERRHQLAGSLSGGEQQMLALARAFMARPRVLLLDEPSLGLAPLVAQQIFAALRHAQRQLGTSMIVVEQAAELVLGMADHVHLLESGRVVVQGSPEQIREDDAVRRAYLGY